MRILLLTDNFVPETNSPARRAYEHAKVWVAAGASVTVVTSIPNFPTGRPFPPYRNRICQVETIEGIRVVRVWTVLAANSGILWRCLDFLSFALSGFVAGLREPCDLILATSPQLLTGVAGRWLAAVKRKPWVFEVRDLWPESIVAVGAMRKNLFVRGLAAVAAGLYRSATRVISVSSGIRDRLVEQGVPAEKIGVVPNGVDLRRFAESASPPPHPERFVAAYIGTHGMAQGLETVLGAAEWLAREDVQVLFVGDGARREALLAQAQVMGLPNVRFLGLVASEVAAQHLLACDVVLIPLKRTDQIEITLPGKLFEAAAAGKPIVVGAEGASAELVRRYGAGLVVPPEDSQALAAAILQLRNDSSLRARLSAGALSLARDFNRDRFAREMLEQLALAVRVEKGKKAGPNRYRG